jgi:hypothetical protein
MMTDEINHVMVWWGPGILVLMVLTYGLLRLAHYWIEKTTQVKSQKMESSFGLARQYVEQFLGAQRSQADALSRLATCTEHRESIDSFEHQEILIALKAMHRDLDSLTCRHGANPCALSQAPDVLERLRAAAGPSAGEPSPAASISRLASASILTGGERL